MTTKPCPVAITQPTHPFFWKVVGTSGEILRRFPHLYAGRRRCNASRERNLAQFGQAAGTQFAHYLGSIQFDGSRTDTKCLSDDLVGAAIY